jgi:multidrug transporter EmrE-like cation transporter
MSTHVERKSAAGIVVKTLTERKQASFHVAYPVTQRLAVIGVQVLAAWLLFRETIAPHQWLGTALVVAGIALITVRAR